MNAIGLEIPIEKRNSNQKDGVAKNYKGKK